MSIYNPDIIGIKIAREEFKLTQFADDTTIIMDDTSASLRATLNVLEIFGDYFGLKMNKEKTKVIWIGRKKIFKGKIEDKSKF